MVGTGADDSDADAIFLVPSGVSVHHVEFAPCVEVALGQLREEVERGSSDGLVDISPGNLMLADGVVNDGLGGRGAARSCSGEGHKGT